MKGDDILKKAEKLYQEAFNANAYYIILKQYQENSEKYNAEMRLSPAFYHTVYNALQVACFMELAKLYDTSRDVFCIGSLIKECKNSLSLFPEYRAIEDYEIGGQKYTFHIPYQHELRKEEECFFEDQVKSQREILKLFDVHSTDELPVRVDLKFPEFLELYYKRFCGLRRKLENIRVQRNKIYAHNDPAQVFDYDEIIERNPVYYSDLKELIDFGLDVTKLIIACLTDICRADSYHNINDWEATLKFAELGLKYKDYDHELEMKEFEKQLRSQAKE